MKLLSFSDSIIIKPPLLQCTLSALLVLTYGSPTPTHMHTHLHTNTQTHNVVHSLGSPAATVCV